MSKRIGGVYYFCPVFSFTVPSPSVERDPFPPLTMGVREATHKLYMWIRTVYSTHPHSHMCSLIQMLAKVIALTHTLSPSLITLFCLGRVSFFKCCFLSPQLLTSSSLSFVPILHGLGSLLAKRVTNTLFVKLSFVNTMLFQCKNIWWRFFKTKYTQRKTLSPWLLLLCFQPSSSSSSSELLLIPSFLFQLPRMPCGRRRSGSMSWRGHWGRAWTPLHIGRLSGRKRRVPVFRPRDRFTWYFTHWWKTRDTA